MNLQLNLKKIKLNKAKAFLKNLPRVMAQNAFFAFLLLLILELAVGFTLYYKYGFLVGKIEPETTEISVQFQEETYQEILKEWQERAEVFEKTQTKEYPNPF